MLRKVTQFQDGRRLYRWDDGYCLEKDSIPYEDAVVMLVEHAVGLDRIDGENWVDSLHRRVPEEDLQAIKKQLSLGWRARVKHFIVVKLKSREIAVQGQITAPTAFLRYLPLEISGERYEQTQVEWVDGSQDGREAAAGSGYKLLEPSAWYVYGPAYRMESVAAGKRKAAARHAQEASGLVEARGIW
jgi:hypothetical protein